MLPIIALLLPTAGAFLLAPVPLSRSLVDRRAVSPRCAEDADDVVHDDDEGSRYPKVTIEYCTRCNWMLRSAWLSQELLTTFNGTIAEVALAPNHVTGGIFEIVVMTGDGTSEIVWSRSFEEGFPESKVLKQRVRDLIDPGKDLGHSEDGRIDKEGTRGTAFSRLLSVILGDRSPNDPRRKKAEGKS